jgi:hypothetical protein
LIRATTDYLKPSGTSAVISGTAIVVSGVLAAF